MIFLLYLIDFQKYFLYNILTVPYCLDLLDCVSTADILFAKCTQ